MDSFKIVVLFLGVIVIGVLCSKEPQIPSNVKKSSTASDSISFNEM